MSPNIRNTKYGMTAVGLALSLTMLTYLSFSKLSILYFGIENIHQNIFDNFSSEFDFLSQFLKLIFLVIFYCALPFNLHPLKVATFNLVEELRR